MTAANAEELVRAGRLDDALKTLSERVRAEPNIARHRIFLFQLLTLRGEWSRALTQLNVVGEMDASALLMVNTCRPLLQCEALRTEVFAGAVSPVIFGEPKSWVAGLVQALKLDQQGKAAEAEAARAAAFEQAEGVAGSLDGEPFEWIADADSRLGPCLELIVNGRYGWVPWTHLRKLSIEAPSDLRDLVWAAAQITWAAGGETIGFIPVRYEGSQSQADPLLQMARKTEWRDLGSGDYAGLGQRLLTTDRGDHPLLEVREIVLGSAQAS